MDCNKKQFIHLHKLKNSIGTHLTDSKSVINLITEFVTGPIHSYSFDYTVDNNSYVSEKPSSRNLRAGQFTNYTALPYSYILCFDWAKYIKDILFNWLNIVY